MTTLMVNLAGLALMAFIIWWFWLWTPRKVTRAREGVITITVEDGVYDPAWIEARRGEPITLRFVRKDPSPCAQQVLFEDLGISEELPMDQPRDIRLQPEGTGTYRFTCQMQMYQGQLRVTE